MEQWLLGEPWSGLRELPHSSKQIMVQSLKWDIHLWPWAGRPYFMHLNLIYPETIILARMRQFTASSNIRNLGYLAQGQFQILWTLAREFPQSPYHPFTHVSHYLLVCPSLPGSQALPLPILTAGCTACSHFPDSTGLYVQLDRWVANC